MSSELGQIPPKSLCWCPSIPHLCILHWSFWQQDLTLYVWSSVLVSKDLYKKLCSSCSDSLRQPEPQPHILEQKCVLPLDNLQMIRLPVGYIIIVSPLLMKGSQATLTRLSDTVSSLPCKLLGLLQMGMKTLDILPWLLVSVLTFTWY